MLYNNCDILKKDKKKFTYGKDSYNLKIKCEHLHKYTHTNDIRIFWFENAEEINLFKDLSKS